MEVDFVPSGCFCRPEFHNRDASYLPRGGIYLYQIKNFTVVRLVRIADKFPLAFLVAFEWFQIVVSAKNRCINCHLRCDLSVISLSRYECHTNTASIRYIFRPADKIRQQKSLSTPKGDGCSMNLCFLHVRLHTTMRNPDTSRVISVAL